MACMYSRLIFYYRSLASQLSSPYLRLLQLVRSFVGLGDRCSIVKKGMKVKLTESFAGQLKFAHESFPSRLTFARGIILLAAPFCARNLSLCSHNTFAKPCAWQLQCACENFRSDDQMSSHNYSLGSLTSIVESLEAQIRLRKFGCDAQVSSHNFSLGS